MYSTPTVSLPVCKHAGGVALSGADAHQRHADHAAQFQVGDAVLRPRLIRAQRVEVHGQQFAAMLQRAMDHLARHAQIRSRAGCAPLVPRHSRFQRRRRTRSSRNPRSAPVIGERRIHHRCQHIVDREGALQRARQIQNGAQLPQIAADALRRAAFSASADLLHQALQFRAIQCEHQLIGILRAEFDAVRVLQNVRA